jgi:hypothetical protein
MVKTLKPQKGIRRKSRQKILDTLNRTQRELPHTRQGQGERAGLGHMAEDKNAGRAWSWWLTPFTLCMWEAEIRRITDCVHPGQIVP